MPLGLGVVAGCVRCVAVVDDVEGDVELDPDDPPFGNRDVVFGMRHSFANDTPYKARLAPLHVGESQPNAAQCLVSEPEAAARGLVTRDDHARAPWLSTHSIALSPRAGVMKLGANV